MKFGELITEVLRPDGLTFVRELPRMRPNTLGNKFNYLLANKEPPKSDHLYLRIGFVDKWPQKCFVDTVYTLVIAVHEKPKTDQY